MLPAMAAPTFARVRTAGGVVVCERCEMLIDRAGSVHMFFMRFPIDVVFLARDRTVVWVKHRLAPWRVAGARHAVASLELPAGRAAEVGVEKGDILVFEDVSVTAETAQ